MLHYRCVMLLKFEGTPPVAQEVEVTETAASSSNDNSKDRTEECVNTKDSHDHQENICQTNNTDTKETESIEKEDEKEETLRNNAGKDCKSVESGDTKTDSPTNPDDDPELTR